MDDFESPLDLRSTAYSNPCKMAPTNMSALDRLSKRLTSIPVSRTTPRKRKRFYKHPEVITVQDVWLILYKQASQNFPLITPESTVEDIRKACLYPMASLEQLAWLGKIETCDHSIIYKVLIMLEHIAAMVDTSFDSELIDVHEELVSIINVCRGINGYQEWYGNGLYGWRQEHGWDLSSEEALEYLADILREWNPRKWRRERAMELAGEQKRRSSAEAKRTVEPSEEQTWVSSADKVNRESMIKGLKNKTDK